MLTGEKNKLIQKFGSNFFNKFVEIKTDKYVDGWLHSAGKIGINPVIYTYVAHQYFDCKKIHDEKECQRFTYASKILEHNNNLKLVENIIDNAKDFKEFCSHESLNIKDIINENYNEKIKNLTTCGKYLTVAELTQINKKNKSKIKEFVKELDSPYDTVYDIYLGQLVK